MNQFLRKRSATAKKSQPLAELTRRELEILKMIAEEYTNQEIADKLFISPRIVDTFAPGTSNLYQNPTARNNLCCFGRESSRSSDFW